MSAVLLQYVIAVSSALTATTMVYIAREANEARKTIYDNEERSMVNRAVLRQEGMAEPITDDPTKGNSWCLASVCSE